MLLLRDYGTMRLADVLSPAIGYWLNGHPLVERASATIATVAEQFRNHWPTSAAVFLPGDKVPAPGSLFRNPAVGNTYARILKEAEAGGGGREAEIERARKAWSQGFVAEAIDRFCRTQEVMDVSGKRNKGVLRGDDMAKWQATVEAPLTYDYGRYTVCKAGPWTQGPVVLQQLALLKGFNLDGMDPTSADFIHLQVECEQARLCRPRGLLRRSGVRRRADEDPAVGRLQCRPPQADRSGAGLARAAAGQGRRLWRRGEAAPRRRRRGWAWRRAAPASRRSAGSARPPATRCISTSSTATAT